MRRTADVALLVAIALAVVTTIGLFSYFFPNVQIPHVWWMFGAVTVFLWATLAQAYWHVRRLASLWLFLALALIMHCTLYAVLLHRYPRWPAITYFLTGPTEVMALAYLIWILLKVKPQIL